MTNASINEIIPKINGILDEISDLRAELSRTRQELVQQEFDASMGQAINVKDVSILSVPLEGADAESLRQMTDRFRQKFTSGVVAVGSIVNEKPMIVCAVTEDVVKKGIHAGELVRQAAALLGGSGGGRPVLGQAGGKDAEKLSEALDLIAKTVREKLQNT